MIRIMTEITSGGTPAATDARMLRRTEGTWTMTMRRTTAMTGAAAQATAVPAPAGLPEAKRAAEEEKAQM